jgi:hypothetical protein
MTGIPSTNTPLIAPIVLQADEKARAIFATLHGKETGPGARARFRRYAFPRDRERCSRADRLT